MDSMLACLADWMPTQRWYASKGQRPDLTLVSALPLPMPAEAEAHFLLVRDEASALPVLYAVPVRTHAATDVPGSGTIAQLPTGRWLQDATHDDAAMRALATFAMTSGRHHGLQATTGTATGPPTIGREERIGDRCGLGRECERLG